MTLEILTPDKTVYEGEATSVTLPGTLGFFEILQVLQTQGHIAHGAAAVHHLRHSDALAVFACPFVSLISGRLG